MLEYNKTKSNSRNANLQLCNASCYCVQCEYITNNLAI